MKYTNPVMEHYECEGQIELANYLEEEKNASNKTSNKQAVDFLGETADKGGNSQGKDR